MLQQIRDWLNGNRAYEYGIILLKQCPPVNDQLINLLIEVGPNSRNNVRLHQALLKEYESLRLEAPAVVVDASDRIEEAKAKPHSSLIIHNSSLKNSKPSKPAQHTKPPKPSKTYEDSPIYLSARQEANLFYKDLMNERAILFNHCKVENWEDVNQPVLVQLRSKAAVKIIQDYRHLSALYDKAEFIRVNGRLPFAENHAENEYDALPDYLVKTTIDKLRNNINKMRKRELNTERIALIEKHEENLKKLRERWHLLKPQP